MRVLKIPCIVGGRCTGESARVTLMAPLRSRTPSSNSDCTISSMKNGLPSVFSMIRRLSAAMPTPRPSPWPESVDKGCVVANHESLYTLELIHFQDDQDHEPGVLRPTGVVYAHAKAPKGQPQTGRGLFEVECDAVQSELGPHGPRTAPIEALEPLALAKFGKDALHDRAAQPVS